LLMLLVSFYLLHLVAWSSGFFNILQLVIRLHLLDSSRNQIDRGFLWCEYFYIRSKLG
jgi:hypothetical protein